MRLDPATFRQLRRLAPFLDDVLNAGEVEYAEQAVNLVLLGTLCSKIYDAYRCLNPDQTDQARLDAFEPE